MVPYTQRSISPRRKEWSPNNILRLFLLISNFHEPKEYKQEIFSEPVWPYLISNHWDFKLMARKGYNLQIQSLIAMTSKHSTMPKYPIMHMPELANSIRPVKKAKKQNKTKKSRQTYRSLSTQRLF